MVMRNCVQATRKRRRLTVTELARRAGTSRQTIVSLERDNGRYIPKADLMFRLAQALNEDVGSLFWQEQERAAV